MVASPEGLYVGTSNSVVVPENTPGCQVWVYDGNQSRNIQKGGFGHSNRAVDASSMAVFNGQLYVGTGETLFDPSKTTSYGCMIFRYDPAGSTWTQVNPDTAPGFGDTHNEKATVMLPTNYGLLVGTQYFSTRKKGGEAWLLPTTFYFAEGTTRANFDTYFCIQNPGNAPASAVLTYMKGDGTTASQDVLVPATGRATVHPADVLVTAGSTPCDFSTTVQCTNSEQLVAERPMYFNYNGWTGGHDVVGAISPASTFYFAEGTTRPGFDTYFCIQNPGVSDASVYFMYMKSSGSSAGQGINVPAGSRATVRPADVLLWPGADPGDFSTTVGCTNGQRIIAERSMYFDYEGVTGGHDVVGAISPASAFYFAEGTTRPGFDTYFCIQNPGGSTASIEITYMKADGTTLTQNTYVRARSRATIAVDSVLGVGDDAAHDFSASIECTNGQRIIAERPMYFDYNGWTGGHDVIGATSPSSVFYFAEGSCRPGFDPYLAVQNPGGTVAEVTVTYMKEDGTTRSRFVSVAAFSRATLHPADVLGVGDDAAHDFSARVECTNGQRIIAERPMYFDYNGWTGGHDVVGFAH